MIGTALILLLTVVIAGRLRGFPPAARVGLASAAAIGGPVIFLVALARLGIHADSIVMVCLLAVLIGWAFIATRRRQPETDDSYWLGALALAFVVASLSALLGRPPTIGVLIDPWAHVAWSRDLPDALRFYPPGLPAFIAVLGLDDRLIGAFRFSPFLLHAALAAQFLALGERVGAIWPAAAAVLAYLVIPVAFGKFEPPRPELLAAVFIAASWWILLFELPNPTWKNAALGILTCALLISHFSAPEIAHLAALGLAIILGHPARFGSRRAALLLSIVTGIGVSLIISPWPLILVFRPELLPFAAVRFGVDTFPGPLTVARMFGLGLSVASAASVLWIVFHWKKSYNETNGVLLGLCVLGVLNVIPLATAAAGIPVPIPLEPYRYLLAAALPLVMIVTVVAGLSSVGGRTGKIGVPLCVAVFGLDLCLRPTFSVPLGVIAAVMVVTTWWTARRARRSTLLAAAVALALVFGIAARLVIWRPTPPPQAAWLDKNGNPDITVATNWPLTNALDALVPQRVVDGLAGNDGSGGRHRAAHLPPLHDRLNWCGEYTEASVESLRVALGEMDALPAYLVVGDRFEEAWKLYSEQRGQQLAMGHMEIHPFYGAVPCPEAAAYRLEKIRSALEKHRAVTIEFSAEHVIVYRIE